LTGLRWLTRPYRGEIGEGDGEMGCRGDAVMSTSKEAEEAEVPKAA